MKKLLIILALIPTPFLYEYIRYNDHVTTGEDTPFLFPSFFIATIIVGILISKLDLRIVLVAIVGMYCLSLLCGYLLIPNDSGWFKPFSRETIITIMAIPYAVCLIVVRLFVRVFEYLVLNK